MLDDDALQKSWAALGKFLNIQNILRIIKI